MPSRVRYALVVAAALLLGATPSAYSLLQQTEENRIVDAYLEANSLSGLPVTRETAIRISDQVRRDFNVDESSFKTLRMENRPFLREDTGFLLRHREGLCGEGTRVLVNLLQRAGFDATRITLYGRHLNSAHTLVSVVLDGQEFLVDSINSTPETNAYLRSEMVQAGDFSLLHYTDDYDARRALHRARTNRPANAFFQDYWIYSYEATPYAKVLNRIGMDLRVFNFDRPPVLISGLAEKPHLIRALAALVVATSLTLLLHFTGILPAMAGTGRRTKRRAVLDASAS